MGFNSPFKALRWLISKIIVRLTVSKTSQLVQTVCEECHERSLWHMVNENSVIALDLPLGYT